MSENDTSGQFVGEPVSEEVRVTVLTLGLLACINGVFGNVLIITTLLSQQALRSVHNIYIANLALADLLLSGYSLPMWLLDLYLGYHPVLNAAHCLFNSYGTNGTFSASILTLIAISINRYVSVCHHHIFVKVFTKQRTVLFCLATWVVGFLLCLPSYLEMEANDSGYDPAAHMCVFTRDSTKSSNSSVRLYARVYTAAMLILPSIVVGLANGAIFRHWRRSKRRVQKWRPQCNHGHKVKVKVSEASNIACDEGQCARLPPQSDSSGLTQPVCCVRPYLNTDAGSVEIGQSSFCVSNSQSAVSVSSVKPGQSGFLEGHVEKVSPNKVLQNLELHVYRVQQSHETSFVELELDQFAAGRDSVSQRGDVLSPVTLSPDAESRTLHATEHGHSRANHVMPRVPYHNENNSRNVFDACHNGEPFAASGDAARCPSPKPSPEATNGLIRHGHVSRHRHLPLSTSDISLIRSLLTVFVCCVLLYLPLSVATILGMFSPQASNRMSLTVMCAFLNHSINWIVYGMMNRAFREGYKEQLAACFSQRRWTVPRLK